jgi:hypothetical protein
MSANGAREGAAAVYAPGRRDFRLEPAVGFFRPFGVRDGGSGAAGGLCFTRSRAASSGRSRPALL